VSIGVPEIVVIVALILILLGPEKMPEMMRSMGRAWVEITRAKNSFMAPLQDEVNQVTRSARSAAMDGELKALKEEFTDGDK
jgi:sec-independent protein translocase protein TatB